MKAITVRQPWATLLVRGEKMYEHRSRRLATPGWLLVHAGAKDRHLGLCYEPYYHESLERCGIDHTGDIPLSAIIGAVRFGDSIPFAAVAGLMTERQRAFVGYESGGFLWPVVAWCPFHEPIPCKGQLSLWIPPKELECRIKIEFESCGMSMPPS